jgi:hypothetical protein
MVIANRCGNIRGPDAVQGLLWSAPKWPWGRPTRYIVEHCVVNFSFAPVAQLDRAPGYEPGGREFESLRAHHRQNY